MAKGPFCEMFDEKKDMLKPVYFNIEVLERYFKNPKYAVNYTDYRGGISLKDEYYEFDDSHEYEYIKDFGLAYLKTDMTKRAVVVFADDLIKMPHKVQSHWFAYYLDNQCDYVPNDGFVINLFYGEWVNDISIYQALLMELHYINKMCNAITIPHIFREEFSFNDSDQNSRPNGYHNILLPTRENYFNFVNTLEKITTTNINVKAFLHCVPPLVQSIERCYVDDDGNERPKGSVTMLREWLEKNVRTQDLEANIIKPLKDLVKLRQTPAHKLYSNEYDEVIWEDQNQLIHSVYTAIRGLRLLLANHPNTRTVEIPSVLFDGEHIRIY